MTDFTHAIPRTLCGVNPLSTYKFGAILMAAKRGNLPIELSSFVGRRSEAKEVRRLLSDYRLVTLTGLGGVGKTRLALRAADDSSRTFPGGVWFVDFSELREPALLDQTILAALGVQDRSTRSPRSVLIGRLVDERVLLVLDNCEHLIGWVADTPPPNFSGAVPDWHFWRPAENRSTFPARWYYGCRLCDFPPRRRRQPTPVMVMR